jgi:hypothetical protein
MRSWKNQKDLYPIFAYAKSLVEQVGVLFYLSLMRYCEYNLQIQQMQMFILVNHEFTRDENGGSIMMLVPN